MPHGNLTTHKFSIENYFLFYGIKIPVFSRRVVLFCFEKIHSG